MKVMEIYRDLDVEKCQGPGAKAETRLRMVPAWSGCTCRKKSQAASDSRPCRTLQAPHPAAHPGEPHIWPGRAAQSRARLGTVGSEAMYELRLATTDKKKMAEKSTFPSGSD